MTAHKKSQRFSVIEFLSVLVVLAVLAVVLALLFSPFRHIQLESAVDKMMADIRYCQELAIYRNADCAVLFEPGRSRYALYIYDGSVRKPVRDPMTRLGPLRVDFAAGVYKGFKISAVNVNKGTELRFAAGSGIPADASRTPLARPATVVITSSAGSVAVSVDPETGCARRS